ncbi:MAG: spore cortex biosynthesis protein YabQ [Anaerovoracaceae bacterium]
MSQLIREQIFGFCVMFFCGAGIAMLRQLFRSYQRDCKPRKSIFVIQEMLFWIVAALITSACLYYAGYGAVTVYGVVGFTLGAFLWYNIRKHNAK